MLWNVDVSEDPSYVEWIRRPIRVVYTRFIGFVAVHHDDGEGVFLLRERISKRHPPSVSGIYENDTKVRLYLRKW